MENSSDLSKYYELRKRIIRNEDLSDSEWELFFELEMKNKEMKKQKETWDSLFLNSVLVPEVKKATLKKNFNLKDALSILKPVMTRKYQYAYAGLVVFFIIGFLSYSMLNKNNIEKPETVRISQNNSNQQQILIPGNQKRSDFKKNNDDLLTYSENPYLENYITDVVRSVSKRIELTSPQPSLRFKLKEGKESPTLTFSGNILSKESPNSNIFLKVFTNNKDEYSNDIPLIKENLEFRENNSEWIFSKEINQPLKKGLYYFSIEDTMNDEILYLNKFYIY